MIGSAGIQGRTVNSLQGDTDWNGSSPFPMEEMSETSVPDGKKGVAKVGKGKATSCSGQWAEEFG